MRERLRAFAIARAASLNTPMLVAFASKGDGVFGLRGQSAATESEAVYVIRLDHRTGKTISFDHSMVRMSIVESNNTSLDSRSPMREAVRIHDNGHFIALYRLPIPPDARVTSLVVTNAPPSSRSVAVNTWLSNYRTGKWDQFNATVAPIGNPEHYVSPAGDVKMKVKQAGGGSVRVQMQFSGTAQRR